MEASNIPAKFPIPFGNSAASGTIRAIPVASQIGVQAGAASLTDGFPPVTLLPTGSGGTPPFAQDMNGLLNQSTSWDRWFAAGGPIAYDATFQTEIGGYPSGAVIQSAATPGGFWRSTVDNNTTDPDAGGAGWVVAFSSGLVGSARNLVISVTTASLIATLTADEIISKTALGFTYKLISFNQTINLATTGAGGMDTGAAPESGYVANYAIFNPTTNAAALLATNATTTVAPSIYGGANMPAGFTASALVSVWPTNSSREFVVGTQIDRSVSIFTAVALNTSTNAVTPTPLEVASILPPNARTVTGNLSITCPSSSSGIASSADVVGNASSVGALGITFDVGPIGGSTGAIYSDVPVTTRQTIFYIFESSSTASITINIVRYSF
jgi:hypothetical protein